MCDLLDLSVLEMNEGELVWQGVGTCLSVNHGSYHWSLLSTMCVIVLLNSYNEGYHRSMPDKWSL